ncbi:Glycosyl transferase family 2 [Salmonella enterica]|uniref:Glycosyl transferase family 2 n=1 Tax=Salmonella enterica TaxID=28901 RepID=A0A379QRN6_SALER|nr:Glycosyl transferase family 2 [Salmonella enterica]
MEKSLLVIVRHKPGRTRLLMRALKSINDQTFKKINIVIFCMGEKLKYRHVDDFYLKELSNKYRIIYDENRIFDAIKMSKSNYLCFIDDDDSWAPEYVSRLLSLLANIQSMYSSVNAISCHANKVNEIAENNRVIINSTQP